MIIVITGYINSLNHSMNYSLRMESPEMKIRLLTQNDCSLILKIAPDNETTASILFTIAKTIKDGFDGISYIYGAFIDDLMVGFVYGLILPNKTLLPQYLYVDINYRGQKIGKKLLKKLEKESGAICSMAYFEKGLRKYYSDQGYMIGDLLVALKYLPENAEGNFYHENYW